MTSQAETTKRRLTTRRHLETLLENARPGDRLVLFPGESEGDNQPFTFVRWVTDEDNWETEKYFWVTFDHTRGTDKERWGTREYTATIETIVSFESMVFRIQELL